MLAAGANIWYLRTLVHDKALIHIDTFSAEVGSTNSYHFKYILLGLGTYSFPVNTLSDQKPAVCRGMRKPYILK